MSGSPRCRSDNDGPGPLTLASNACPDLRELEVGYWHLDQPPGPLAQLTRLSLTAVTAPPDGAPVLRSLVEQRRGWRFSPAGTRNQVAALLRRWRATRACGSCTCIVPRRIGCAPSRACRPSPTLS